MLSDASAAGPKEGAFSEVVPGADKPALRVFFSREWGVLGSTEEMLLTESNQESLITGIFTERVRRTSKGTAI